jgi:hypothetical protein
MDKIYSQILCNNSAAASSSGEEGCFRQRNLLLLDPLIIESSWTDQLNEEYYVYPYDNTYLSHLRPPLLRRGWVVPEYVISRRFLHFDAKQVFFECGQGYVSEMYPKAHLATCCCRQTHYKNQRNRTGRRWFAMNHTLLVCFTTFGLG